MPLSLLVPAALVCPAPVFFEEKAAALLAEVTARGKSLKSFSAKVTMTAIGPQPQKMSGQVLVQNPDKGRVELSPESGPGLVMITNGSATYSISGNQYTKGPADPSATWPFLVGIPGSDASKFVYVGTEKIGDVTLDIVELKEKAETIRAYITPEKIIQRLVMTMEMGGEKQGTELQLSAIQLDPVLDAASFTLPAGVTERKSPASAGAGSLEASLLKVGARAPGFQLATPEGGKLSLAQALKGKKAVLVNFWFVGCPPCRAEHPELQKLYSKLKSKGLGLVAVNQGDASKDILSYMSKAGLTFPAVKGVAGTFSAYGVQAYPTNYLVDSTGKIVYRSVGFDEAQLKAALGKLGLK